MPICDNEIVKNVVNSDIDYLRLVVFIIFIIYLISTPCLWWPISLIWNNHCESVYGFEIEFKIEFEVKPEVESEFKIDF